MRIVLGVVTVFALTASPLWAQSERGYVEAAGGFAVSPDATAGDVLGEIGGRIGPHLLVFGDVGQFRNLQPSQLQPTVQNTMDTLSTTDGLSVVGTARVPAWYSIGGLRLEMPTASRVSPYVLGGVGFARLTPTARFTYTNGPLAGSTPALGDDVTQQLISVGDFTQPAATNAFMFSLGGGLALPVARHWAVDAGYRFSRVNAATPVNVQGITFGGGYRF